MFGLEYSNEHVKTKLNFNPRTYETENLLAAKVHHDALLGYHLVYDGANLKKYDAGLSWTPAPKVTVGIQHQSDEKRKELTKLPLNKVFLYFHHIASTTNTVGTEFCLHGKEKEEDKRQVSVRAGFSHQFNDETSGKARVNQNGILDLTVKHKFNSNVTGTATLRQVDLLNLVANQSITSRPLGFQLDFKL